MPGALTVLYFAWLRERVGVAEEKIALPADGLTVAGLVAYLAGLDQRHANAFKDRETVRSAVNQEFADPGTVLRPGDEVAFFPPVTGG
jgi:molybdopterin converting factor subunit 1